MDPLSKADVVAALLRLAREELAALEQMMQMSRDEATSPESRPENQYDTRAIEASYLAAGQGQRAIALRRLVGFLEAQPEAPQLFGLEGAAGPAWYLLAPDGGGRRIRVGERDIVVVTAASPVGAALQASREGDVLRIGASGEFEVVSIG
jgi:hypothetical protein